MTEIVWRKLEELSDVLLDLKKHLKKSKPELQNSHYEIERQVQLCVDMSLSIARRLLLIRRMNIPETGRDCFALLHKFKIIPKKMSEDLQNTVGLRNIIVHEYDGINYDILFGGLPAGHKLFVSYLSKVEKYIERPSKQKKFK